MLGIETDHKRIFGLDFLRAVAIFLVVHGHGASLLLDTRLSFLTKIPLPDVVDIFFVLTGFLIGGSFLSYAEKNTGVDIRKTLRFYVRSALRILPYYYLILIVYLILVHNQLVPGNTESSPVWQFATFTQNLFTPFYDFYWESWCLPIQWWFYMFFPLLMTLFSGHFGSRRLVPVICAGFISVSILFRILVSGHATDLFGWDVWIRRTVASRCDAVYIGVLAAWVQMYAPDVWRRHALKSLLVGLALLVMLVLITQKPGTIFKNVFSCTFQTVSFAMLLPFMSCKSKARTAWGGFVSHISVLSFAMYMVNLVVMQLILANFNELFHQWGAWGYVVYWMIVLVLSYLLYMMVEKPFMKLRTRVSLFG